ncbi:chain length determinant protein EpsF [Aquabacterium lacunae]|uniref:Chain length determinant protein EpsF n=1 Tax=Aquabacterium lacunae TaxID=2528630 RepID=A0A4Q9H2K7_9BURK|nr:chain length determinant protein EpsF [Aquabacterium lacunae]TBO28318.1 chain length determinant protein EpsF [Aquabacterium lacunae]
MLTNIVKILSARWKPGLLTFLLVITLVGVITIVVPKKFTSTATVLVDLKNSDPLQGQILPAMLSAAYMATQVDIIKSERVAIKAVRNLKLDEYQPLKEQWRAETDGAVPYESWLTTLFQRKLEVIPSRESSVLNISYSASDPQFAAALCNAFLAAYVEVSLELRTEPAKNYGQWFELQAAQARARLEKAQNELSSFQQKNGIVGTAERIDIEVNRLSELNGQLVQVQALSADAKSRKDQGNENSPEVLGNAVVASLKTELSRQESKLKELATTLGPEHPQVKTSQESIKELRDRLSSEVRRVAGSLAVNSAISNQREATLRESIELQKNKLAELKQVKDQAALLERDVESAQRAYDSLLARQSITDVESKINQTNISVLRKASPSPEPSFPNPVLNALVGAFLAVFASAAVIVLAEANDRRVRSEEDLNVVGLSLLTTIGIANQRSLAVSELDRERPVGALGRAKVMLLGLSNKD